MSDLAAVLTTESTRLSDAERREIVVEQETFGRLSATVSVDHLGLIGSGKGRKGKSLSLTTGEES
jgi:hypothetical protein